MNFAVENSDFSLDAANLMPEINFAPLVFADDEDISGILALHSIYIGWMTTWNTIMAVVYSAFVLIIYAAIFFLGLIFAGNIDDWSWIIEVF